MTAGRFLDDLARTMAEPMPRRRAVRVIGVSLAAIAVPGFIPRLARAQVGCTKSTCGKDQRCCQKGAEANFKTYCLPGSILAAVLWRAEQRLQVHQHVHGRNEVPDGTIAAWLAAGSDWIEALVEQALGGAGTTPGLPVGAELPPLRASRLDGSEVELTDVIERETALLFWNPGCGFCRSLHADILAWEASPPEGAPALVVVSAGEPVDVSAEGFASQVLLDPEWTVSGSLGADGTPMAVLVSADARIASPVAGGGPAVLELLGAGALSTAP